MLGNNKKIVRSIIIKLTNAFEKQLVFKNLMRLKEYNETWNLKPKNPGDFYVTEHLPRELQMQKKKLIPIFRKAKEEGKKTAWKIIDGGYQLYIDGEQFLFE